MLHPLSTVRAKDQPRSIVDRLPLALRLAHLQALPHENLHNTRRSPRSELDHLHIIFRNQVSNWASLCKSTLAVRRTLHNSSNNPTRQDQSPARLFSRLSSGNTVPMTMVIDNQGRHYGGMGYDHMYPNMHNTPQFSDPWSHQTSNSGNSFPALSKTESSRSGITMPYSHMPPVSGPMAQGSAYSSTGYSGTDLLNFPQDIPRSTYADQTYSAPSATSSSYAPSYSSLSYAQSLHQQQQQQQQHQHQQRKLSDS